MPEHIAVIGSGMAGLASAWLCQGAGHRVKVFEAQRARGMDAHTLDIPQPDGAGWVDVPLRVMSPDAWGSVLALAAKVGAQTFAMDIPVSCSWMNGETWLRSQRWQGLGLDMLGVGSWRYLHLKTWTVVKGLRKLRQVTRQQRALDSDAKESLADVLSREKFDPLFVRGLILPLLATICTCREEYLWQWPARPLLSLLDTILHKRPLVRFKGGTRALVQGLTRDLAFCSGSSVTSVRSEGAQLRVSNARGDSELFDRVIVATQANQCSFLDAEEFAREKSLLEEFTFDSGHLYVHSDPRLMPARPSDWVALNYLMDKNLERSMFTVWVQAVEPSLRGGAPIFQSWNPLLEPDPALTQVALPLQRAVVTPASTRALSKLEALHQEQGRRLFFCGAWASEGVPLLESAVRSALAVGRRLHIKSPLITAQALRSPTESPGLSQWHEVFS